MEVGATDPPADVGAVEPPASATKRSGAIGTSEGTEPRIPDAVASPIVEVVEKPMAGTVTALVPPPEPTKPASKSEAGGPDTGQQKRGRTEVDPMVVALPSFSQGLANWDPMYQRS